MEPLTDVFGTQTSAAAMAFGLRGVVDWSVQQPFLNVFKSARPWHAHTEGQWGAYRADDLEAMGVLDENGWITELPPGVERIDSFLLTEMPTEASYTAGVYRLSYDGAGDISVSGADVISERDGEIWFDYEPNGENMVTVSIRSTDPAGRGDYLRNIEVVKEEHIGAYESGQLFNPLWLDVIKDAHSLRFMDWQETNDSTLRHWEDRPAPGDYSYHTGVPVEVMVELANLTGTEPWFNIPWDADATYIREFAAYVRDHLDPDLRAHIELSNEVWNWMFDQAQDAAQSAEARFGQALGDGWVQEYGARSAEMARVLDQVYANDPDRLVKVISTHTYWPGLEEAILEAPAWQAQSAANAAPFLSFDTYAITGYFGNSLGTDAKAPTVLDWIAQSEAQARQEASSRGLRGPDADRYVAEHRFDLAEELAVRELRDGSVTGDGEDSLAGLFDLFAYHKSVADAHGLDLVMYEGGTHVVGIGNWANNDLLTEFFTYLNYSGGMGQLYSELLAGWEAAGGTLFNAFVDVSDPNKWGSWGSLRHLLDDTARHDAIEDLMQSHPAPDHMKDGTWGSGSDNSPPPDIDPDPEPDTPPEPSPDPIPEPVPDPAPNPQPEPNPTAPMDDVREYVFGNSLFAWAIGDPELSVAHWTNVMAESAGSSYAAAIQTGMLTKHDDLPANPHVLVDTVQEAWDRDAGQRFDEAGFNQITISAVNFVQDQTPDRPYWIDPSTTPIASALKTIDWAEARAPGAAINIYQTWPELDGSTSSFPPTDAEYAAWRDYMLGEWNDWWVSLTDALQAARPDLNIRLIAAGPEIAAMLDDPALELSGLDPADLFADDSGQGTPTLYFLASLIHYATLYGKAPPAGMDLADTIHPSVAENFDRIVDWLAEHQTAAPPDPIVGPFVDSAHAPASLNAVTGSDASETLRGTNGDDRIEAGGGDDKIFSGGGRDEIDGGAGADAVVLRGAQSDYTLLLSGDTLTVTQRGAAETATMRNVEFLDFETESAPFGPEGMPIGLFDGMAALGTADMMALTELYIAYFNRAPDAIGLNYWGDRLADGMSLERIAEAFFDQPETRSLYGSLDDIDSFVTSVYRNVLGREPDAQGMSYWLGQLEEGTIAAPNFIQAILAGAKAATGSAADAAYLADKVVLGGHFAVTRGMSDLDMARAVMQTFDGSQAGLEDAVSQTDTAFTEIVDGVADGFLMQIVGISEDAFIL
ncbi:DUF4214 domain-containing protein [Marivita sp. GX14005]|uniref:DUF4214 domain-containing protein n=1 Tax=Marivita sp. GX14005 TaxID=2942276 RepID=UPI002018BDB6|nr:DUF4214 domain-containing protein [Marivita sp. GX14005]MCL3882185.1 DUF4214 domain-containing protein [Marivita sp. GX14005]